MAKRNGDRARFNREQKKKALSFREGRTLEKARKLLIGEISEVLGETKSAAEEQIDEALKARKNEFS